jgi:hypothetical protein
MIIFLIGGAGECVSSNSNLSTLLLRAPDVAESAFGKSPVPAQVSMGLQHLQAGACACLGFYLEQEPHMPVPFSVSMVGDAHIPHMVAWNCCDSRKHTEGGH